MGVSVNGVMLIHKLPTSVPAVASGDPVPSTATRGDWRFVGIQYPFNPYD